MANEVLGTAKAPPSESGQRKSGREQWTLLIILAGILAELRTVREEREWANAALAEVLSKLRLNSVD